MRGALDPVSSAGIERGFPIPWSPHTPHPQIVVISGKRLAVAVFSLLLLSVAIWSFGSDLELRETGNRPLLTGVVTGLWLGEDGDLLAVLPDATGIHLRRYDSSLVLGEFSEQRFPKVECASEADEPAFSFSPNAQLMVAACRSRLLLFRTRNGGEVRDETGSEGMAAEEIGLAEGKQVVDVGFVDDSRILLIYEGVRNDEYELREVGDLSNGRKLGEMVSGTKIWQEGNPLGAWNARLKCAYVVEVRPSGFMTTTPLPLPSVQTAMLVRPDAPPVIGDGGGFVYFVDIESSVPLAGSHNIYPAPVRALASLEGGRGVLAAGDFSGIYQVRDDGSPAKLVVKTPRGVRLLAATGRYVVYGTAAGVAVASYETVRRINGVGRDLVAAYSILLALLAFVVGSRIRSAAG